jgi:hypothetical protein
MSTIVIVIPDDFQVSFKREKGRVQVCTAGKVFADDTESGLVDVVLDLSHHGARFLANCLNQETPKGGG